MFRQLGQPCIRFGDAPPAPVLALFLRALLGIAADFAAEESEFNFASRCTHTPRHLCSVQGRVEGVAFMVDVSKRNPQISSRCSRDCSGVVCVFCIFSKTAFPPLPQSLACDTQQ